MTENMNDRIRQAARGNRRALPGQREAPPAPTEAQLKAAQDLASVLGLTLTEALQRIGYEPAEANKVLTKQDFNATLRKAGRR